MIYKKAIFFLFIYIICEIKVAQCRIAGRRSEGDKLESHEGSASGEDKVPAKNELPKSGDEKNDAEKLSSAGAVSSEDKAPAKNELPKSGDEKNDAEKLSTVSSEDKAPAKSELPKSGDEKNDAEKLPSASAVSSEDKAPAKNELHKSGDEKNAAEKLSGPKADAGGTTELNEPIVFNSGPCRKGEKYDKCTAHCEPTCAFPKGQTCDKQCRSGCKCAKGLVRRRSGRCVKPEQCMSKSVCNEDEVFDECNGHCEATCGRPGLDFCPLICLPGCHCPSGRFRRYDGKCVPMQQCLGVIRPLSGTKPDPVAPIKCWISLNAAKHNEVMEKLENKYKDVREKYAKEIDTKAITANMLHELRASKTAAAARAVQKFGGHRGEIPAGLNLGSNCMMRMPGSLLFFYRLKLRNNTQFVLNYMDNDVEQMTLTMRLSLNDLHLVGEYERALTTREEPSKLFYTPNRGGVEFLLKDVKYKVEGRYRLFDDQLYIEHIISEILPMPILMRFYSDPQGKSTPLAPASLMDYIQRMKNDLDLWIKDYFNDFFMLFKNEELKKNDKMQEYQNERTILLNAYADEALDILNKRLREVHAANLMMPNFTMIAANGMEIRLYSGAVRGVDTMYRRSVTTGRREDQLRYVDTDIGFSALKVEYRYDAYVRTGIPPLSGMFVLSTSDVTAHMGLQVILSGSAVIPDLRIDFLRFGKPETLTVEGPANRIIANFKHVLEHHIISVMSSTLIHHIYSLRTLVECEPNLFGLDEGSSGSKETEEDNNNIEPTDPSPKPAPSSEDNAPTEPTQSNHEDESTEASSEPAPTSDDNAPPEPTQTNNEDESTEASSEPAPTSEDDAPPKPPPSSDPDISKQSDQSNDDGANKEKPDYGFNRKESIELELPPKPGSLKGETMKLDHYEKFSLKKIKGKDSDDEPTELDDPPEPAPSNDSENPAVSGVSDNDAPKETELGSSEKVDRSSS